MVGHRTYNECVYRLIEWRELEEGNKSKVGEQSGARGGKAEEEEKEKKEGEEKGKGEEVQPEVNKEKNDEDMGTNTNSKSEACDAVEGTSIGHEGPIIDAFIAQTASQLTYYGVLMLHSELTERQVEP